MGGIAADALELYDPDAFGRKLIVANDTAGLLSGGGLWVFDLRHDEPGSVDLSVVVRGNTIYRGRYRVKGDEAWFRLNPMNTPRPDLPDGDPTDGGFVLRLNRLP